MNFHLNGCSPGECNSMNSFVNLSGSCSPLQRVFARRSEISTGVRPARSTGVRPVNSYEFPCQRVFSQRGQVCWSLCNKPCTLCKQMPARKERQFCRSCKGCFAEHYTLKIGPMLEEYLPSISHVPTSTGFRPSK